MFDDLTKEITEWKLYTTNPTLPNLAMICNKSLLPKIMCPWGDSVFMNKFGSISIDIIFLLYFDYYKIDMINLNNCSKVIWTRDDFFEMMISMINSFLIWKLRFVHPLLLLVDIQKSSNMKIKMMDPTVIGRCKSYAD